jgi:hypothetical protein
MSKLINIGFGNVVNTDKIVSVIHAESAPARRLMQTARDKEQLIDATQGRKTKCVIVTESEWIILSALLPETIMLRFNTNGESNDTEEEHE